MTATPTKEYTEAEARRVHLPFAVEEEFFLEDIGDTPRKPLYECIKRLVDIACSVAALTLCALPMAVIAVCIKLDSPGTVFYKQERLGLNGKPFTIVKFRTMVMNAEAQGVRWSEGDNDSRNTRIGGFLRKYRLDELPQFWCTLVGSMSLVGPRPERACYYEAFERYIHGFHQRLKVKPGITGLAQTTDYALPPEQKAAYDLEYIKTRSLWTDIKLLFRTLIVVVTHKGE